ncbi:MAG: rhomboid family intramembrane serine protease [Deltaproteobacteria bacterium]|nr:rhomboid family intramembrane serine protease [Deltaproteobacteria bacterium]
MNYYPHYRVSFGGPLTPAVKSILIACGTTFLVQRLAAPDMLAIFGLIPLYVWKKFFIWQLATYIFLHGDIWHLIFNMVALFMFGCELERVWGSRFFWKYFFVTGIGAGICTVCFTPATFVPTIGASGAVFGVLLAYALYYPNRIVYFNFLFPIKIKYLVLIYGIFTFYFSFSGTGGGIAHMAHLGGMLFGFMYLKSDLLIRILMQPIARLKVMWFRRRFRVIHKNNKKRDDNDTTYH